MSALRLALALTAAMSPAAAGAELPPEVYERARVAADTVLRIDVTALDRPRGAFETATCTLRGRVAAVERGESRAVGEAIEIALPCIGATWRPMPGPFPGYDAAGLSRLRSARVYLDGDSLVTRGLDPLTP